MLPSPSDLTYFIEIAGSLNLSRAAERLGVSQPSLTLAIQRLESSVGTSLLLRSNKGVSLTPAGKQLLLRTRELLQSWEKLSADVVSSMDEVRGRYRLGCHAAVAQYVLPPFLPKLLSDFPKLEIQLVHDLSRKVTESVIRMEVELGIVVNPIRHPDLVIHPLTTDEVSLWAIEAVASGGPNSDVLICDPDLIQTQEILSRLKKGSQQFSRVLPTSSLEVVASLTASGAGVGVLPGRVAGLSRGSKAMKRLPKAPVFKDEICLLYRVENRRVKTIQTISQVVIGAFQ